MCEEAGKHPNDHPMFKIRVPITNNRQCRQARKPAHPRAQFVGDVTLRDGSSYYPGLTVEKTWALKNIGESQWPRGVKLLFLSGDLAPESVKEVPRAEPGATVQVSALIKMPLSPKQYTGYYRLTTEDGRKFGPRFWVDLIVIPLPEQQVTKITPKIENKKLDEIKVKPESSTIINEINHEETKVDNSKKSEIEHPKESIDVKKLEESNIDISKPEVIIIDSGENPEESKANIYQPDETPTKVEMVKNSEESSEVSKPDESHDTKKLEETQVKPEVVQAETTTDIKNSEESQGNTKPEVVVKEATSPIITSPYATQLEILKGMGFEDIELNSYLLANNEGNVERVVEWMLNHGPKSR
jgi:hypothetical protein